MQEGLQADRPAACGGTKRYVRGRGGRLGAALHLWLPGQLHCYNDKACASPTLFFPVLPGPQQKYRRPAHCIVRSAAFFCDWLADGQFSHPSVLCCNLNCSPGLTPSPLPNPTAPAGHNNSGTEHILLGLLREGEGVASRVLETLGADPQKIRTQVGGALLLWGGRE